RQPVRPHAHRRKESARHEGVRTRHAADHRAGKTLAQDHPARLRPQLPGVTSFCAIKVKALIDAATQSPAPTIAATPNADSRAGPVEARTAPMRAVATRPPVRAAALLSPEAAPV